jgi:hypothetical protein
MRSMVEGLPDSAGPSTAFHAVPLPIAFGNGEDWGTLSPDDEAHGT